MQRAQGDLAGARQSYEQGRVITAKLVEADPSNAKWQRDLSVSFTNVALVMERLGRVEDALQYALESVQLDERLTRLDPSNITWRQDLTVSRALVERLRGLQSETGISETK